MPQMVIIESGTPSIQCPQIADMHPTGIIRTTSDI